MCSEEERIWYNRTGYWPVREMCLFTKNEQEKQQLQQVMHDLVFRVTVLLIREDSVFHFAFARTTFFTFLPFFLFWQELPPFYFVPSVLIHQFLSLIISLIQMCSFFLNLKNIDRQMKNFILALKFWSFTTSRFQCGKYFEF